MIKLSASVSKKVPVPEVEFSSQSYSASIEIEVASGTQKDEIKQKLRALYVLLEEAIEEQLQLQNSIEKAGKDSQLEVKQSRKNKAKANARKATEAQTKAIRAIAHDRGLTEQQLEDLVRKEFGVTSAAALSVSQASVVIGKLKEKGA